MPVDNDSGVYRTYDPSTHQVITKQNVQIFLRSEDGDWLRMDGERGFVVSETPVLYRGTYPLTGFFVGDRVQNAFESQVYEVTKRQIRVAFSRVTPLRIVYTLKKVEDDG